MNKQIGLWIDHKKTLIVTIDDEGETMKQVESNREKHVRFKGGARGKTPYGAQFHDAEDHRDRYEMEQLHKYYDEVITHIHDAQAVMLFGPGEAKLELQKRLRQMYPNANIVAVEPLDKLTDRQFAAKVREQLLAHIA